MGKFRVTRPEVERPEDRVLVWQRADTAHEIDGVAIGAHQHAGVHFMNRLNSYLCQNEELPCSCPQPDPLKANRRCDKHCALRWRESLPVDCQEADFSERQFLAASEGAPAATSDRSGPHS